jgi:hypothetical protein
MILIFVAEISVRYIRKKNAEELSVASKYIGLETNA